MNFDFSACFEYWILSGGTTDIAYSSRALDQFWKLYAENLKLSVIPMSQM